MGLALDVRFLKFYFGDAYIGDPSWFTNECMFPNLCLPSFKFRIFVEGRGRNLKLTYKCFCHHGFSLFCQSLREYVIPKWIDMIKAMMKHAIQIEPEPKVCIRNIGIESDFRPSDPIFGGCLLGILYRLLVNKHVSDNYVVERDGNDIVLKIEIPKIPWVVGAAIKNLKWYQNELPKHTRLIVECYPFIRVICKGSRIQ